jgi:NAD(P)H-flavin reductase
VEEESGGSLRFRSADGGVALKLVYATRTEDDVLLAAELDALAAGSGGRLTVTYTLSRPGPACTPARRW